MWVTREHPDYHKQAERLRYILAHYEADVWEAVSVKRDAPIDPYSATALGLRSTPYLHRHAQGESPYAYAERQLVSDFTPHFSFIVDSLAGQLFAKEGEAMRTWAVDEVVGPLGDPEEASSVMARLWENADGAGMNWETLWMSLVPYLIAARRWGIYVEAGEAGDDARVRLVSPMDVLDYHEVGGVLRWVKIKEAAPAERGPQDEYEAVTTYLVLDVEGWQRWADMEGGEVLIEEGFYDFADEAGAPIIPFVWAQVPIRRDVGYGIAKKAGAIMNMESLRDWRLWTACVNRLHLTTDQSADKVREGMKAGDSLIITSGDGAAAEYINPSQEPALAATEVIEAKVKELYHVAFRSYADAARQVTATEIAQDVASGVEAFLVLVAKGVDEAENAVLGLLEQVYAPGSSERYAHIQRSRSFQPVIPSEVATGLKDRYFPTGAVPLGELAVRQAAEKIAELDGIEPDADELEAAVRDYVETPARPGGFLTPRQVERAGTARDPLDALANV